MRTPGPAARKFSCGSNTRPANLLRSNAPTGPPGDKTSRGRLIAKVGRHHEVGVAGITKRNGLIMRYHRTAPRHNLLPRHQPQRQLLHDPSGHLKTDIRHPLSARLVMMHHR
jgi:hypothetical protein